MDRRRGDPRDRQQEGWHSRDQVPRRVVLPRRIEREEAYRLRHLWEALDERHQGGQKAEDQGAGKAEGEGNVDAAGSAGVLGEEAERGR